LFKKIFAAFFVSLFMVQSVFAYDNKDLNIVFFNRFNDDCLTYYIKTALENNHDLKKAGYVVEQYRQQAKYSLGNELPSFSVSANYLGIKIPKLDNFQLKQNAFILPFMANYEADLLLKNRDKTRSAKKSYEASKFEEKTVYIALLTDVATVYTNILQYDELIEIQNQKVDIYFQMLKRDVKKFDRGVIDSSQLNRSKQNYETSKNDLEKLLKERDTLLLQLAVLAGCSPEGVDGLNRGDLLSFEYKGVIPSQVNSDVIFARPDVMAAETKLEKAKIDVRVARKEFLPTFNITGLWVFNNIAPGSFFSWESSLAALLAGASQDIFAGGKKVANLRMQKAKYQELFEEYRQTDLEAVKEVNTSLCFVKHDTAIDANTKNKLQYEINNFNNIQKKYNRGVVSYPDYLDAQLKLLSQEKEAAQTKTQRLVNYFTLYKAVGGKL